MEPPRKQPEAFGGYPVWRHVLGAVEAVFVGRGEPAERDEILRRTRGVDLPVAWLNQVHGPDWLEASAGCVGEADALLSDRQGLALAISTADCVPIVLATASRFALIHAGWRGIVAGVVTEVARTLETAKRPSAAWLGPAIGVCCYEVGRDVERRVASAAGSDSVVETTTAGRPHLDLQAAVRLQLEGAGVTAIEVVSACTHCRRDLHSFRREGAGAGRNLTFAWLSDHA